MDISQYIDFIDSQGRIVVNRQNFEKMWEAFVKMYPDGTEEIPSVVIPVTEEAPAS